MMLFFHKNILKCFYHGALRRAAYGDKDSIEQHFQRLKPLAPQNAAQ